MESTFDLASCLASIPDRRRAEGKMYGQVGVILFSIIAMLSGARSYRQIHTLIDRRLAILNAAFPQAALRRAPNQPVAPCSYRRPSWAPRRLGRPHSDAGPNALMVRSPRRAHAVPLPRPAQTSRTAHGENR